MMPATLIHPFSSALNGIRRWIFRPTGPVPGPVLLNHRQIFIVPSRLGLGFALLLLILLVGSLNYELSLGYALAFWLVGVGFASMYHCYRNQSKLSLRYGKCPPVFAGEAARFEIVIDNPSRHARHQVSLSIEEQPPVLADVPASGSAEVFIERPATQRGWLLPGRITIASRYPLGLFYAWSYADFDTRCLIYPTPEPNIPLPALSGEGKQGISRGAGLDDFAGLRVYQPGDSSRHIAWKSAARGGMLLTKQFTGEAAGRLWLTWADTPRDADLEHKLSRLAGWVLAAEQAGLEYGLRLPAQELAPGRGPHHQHQCLRTLALFGQVSE